MTNKDNAPLVVTDVKILQTPLEERQPLESELIQGRMFVNKHGEKICIGMNKKVQEAIGLPFEIFEKNNITIAKQRAAISEIKAECLKLQFEIDKYKKMNFWNRLKFLFVKSKAKPKK